MNMPSSPWNTARACSSCATVKSRAAAEDRARLPTISAALSPAAAGHARPGVLAGLGVGENLPAAGEHQRVDPHHVTLVAGTLLGDLLPLSERGFDHLVPREVRGWWDPRPPPPPATCGTRATARSTCSGPRRACPSTCRSSSGAGTCPSLSRAVSVGGVGTQESRVGELGGIDDVQAHHVDRRSLAASRRTSCSRCGSRRSAASDVDGVGAARGVRALLRASRLAAVVGVDVPRERRWPGHAAASGHGHSHRNRGTETGDSSPRLLSPRAMAPRVGGGGCECDCRPTEIPHRDCPPVAHTAVSGGRIPA